MFDADTGIHTIRQAIELALAPAFLLTGIAGLLNVMSGRLSRVIDRGRRLAEVPPDLNASHRRRFDEELQVLERRRHLASIAIAACTLAALLTCTVILVLFLEALSGFESKWVIAFLFAGSTLSMVAGLTCFLREVFLAAATVSIVLPQLDRVPTDKQSG